jgi:4'-phosphopantetheinyl transferase
MSSAFAAHSHLPAVLEPPKSGNWAFFKKLPASLLRILDGDASSARAGSNRHTPFKDVSVWYLWHTDKPDFALDNHGLTTADFAEFSDLRNGANRARSLATRALLRKALSAASVKNVPPSAWKFERDAHGKPRLADPPEKLHFSCSHTPFLSVIAVSRTRPVGIDIEGLFSASDDPSLIEEFFAPKERLAIQKLPDSGRSKARTRLWALKESVVKMLGTGLALDVSTLEFDTENDRLISCRQTGINPSEMRLATWTVSDLKKPLTVALAVKA